MYISIQEAVVIYARMCRTWYGSGAKRIVTEQALALRKRGDESGSQVWQQVAAEIERLEDQATADPAPNTDDSSLNDGELAPRQIVVCQSGPRTARGCPPSQLYDINASDVL
jgi:hypothetical protein